jgi:uncharacterized integral membrane protein (TIGR00698 family)
MKFIYQLANRDVLLIFVLGVTAWGLGWLLNQSERFSPGASSIAIFSGIAIALVTGMDFHGGRAVIRRLLPVSIVLLGFELDLSAIGGTEIGVTGFAAIAATVTMSFAVAIVGGRLLGLPMQIGAVLGAGGAICGNSAVLAVAPSLRLKHEDIAMVLAAINLLGLAMLFVVVALSDVFQLDPIAAGIWAGSAIHAVPQSIAAGEAIGPEGLAVATAVKLSRVSLLVIVVPLFSVLGRQLHRDKAAEVGTGSWISAFKLPLFVPGFVVAVALGNMLAPDQISDGLGYGGRLLLLPVLAAVGLAVTRTTLMQTGRRVLLVGLLSTIALSAASLAVILAIYD